MGFRWSLSDGKSPQVSRTLLSILAVLNNAVVWMVSTCPLISKSSSPFNNTFSKAPIPIGIIVTFMFHSFFNSRARSRYLSFFSLSVLFCGQLEQQSPQFWELLLLLFLTLIIIIIIIFLFIYLNKLVFGVINFSWLSRNLLTSLYLNISSEHLLRGFFCSGKVTMAIFSQTAF